MAVFLRRLWWCVALLLLQILLLDRVNLWGIVTPLAFFYPILIMDSDVSPASRMLWGFAIGLVADIFVNTPGVQAASLSLLAYAQPFILKLYISFDRRENINPGIASMTFGSYMLYVVTGSLLFNFLTTLFGTSTTLGLLSILLKIVLGTVMSSVIFMLIELTVRTKRRKSYR